MIIILEGVNGTGKTTIANMLKERLNLVIYKPFESAKSPNKIHGERYYGNLQTWGVPVNTFYEDMVAADFISKIKPGIILDRSLPSAIAYDCAGDKSNFKSMLGWWQGKIIEGSRGKVVYVQLEVNYNIAKGRLEDDDRWYPNKKEFSDVQKRFDKVWNLISLPKLKIDTQYKLKTFVNNILDKLNA